MDGAYTIVRYCEVVLYGLVLFGFWRHRETFFIANRQLRMLLVGIGLLVITGAYSSVEILAMGAPGGPRVIVLAVPLLFLTVSLHLDVPRSLHRRMKDRRRG